MIRLRRRRVLSARSTQRTSRGLFVIVLALGLIGLLMPTAAALTSSASAKSTYDSRSYDSRTFTYDYLLAPSPVQGGDGSSPGGPIVPAPSSVTAPTTGPYNNVAAKTGARFGA